MMRKSNARYQRASWILGSLTAAWLLLPVATGTADDTDLFTNQVAPNVVLVFDNSGSMNNIVWHPAFQPDGVYDPVGCPFVADPSDPGYDPTCLELPLCDDPLGSGDHTTLAGSSESACTNTREVFADPAVQADGNSTTWSHSYLEWYFSENVEKDPDGDGNTIEDDIVATGNGSRSQCLIDAGKSPSYELYRRARVTAAKDITREVICNTAQVAEIRYGLAKFFTKTFFGFPLDPEGGWVNVPVDDYSIAQAQALEDAIEAVEG